MGKRNASGSATKKAAKDFKRIKRKVGRKAPLKPNETKTGFKFRRVHVASQSIMDEKGEQVTTRQLNISDLLTKLKHYSASVRKQGFQGLKELHSNHPSAITSRFSQVIPAIFEGLTDVSGAVRNSVVSALDEILDSVTESTFSPLAPLCAAHLRSALTHLHVEMRHTAVEALKLIVEALPDALNSYSLLLASCLMPLLQPPAVTKRRGGKGGGFKIKGKKGKKVAEEEKGSETEGGEARFDALLCVFSLLQPIWGGNLAQSEGGVNRAEKGYHEFSSTLLTSFYLREKGKLDLHQAKDKDSKRRTLSSRSTGRENASDSKLEEDLARALEALWEEEVGAGSRMERLGVIVQMWKLLVNRRPSQVGERVPEKLFEGCSDVLDQFPIKAGKRTQEEIRLAQRINLSICSLVLSLLPQLSQESTPTEAQDGKVATEQASWHQRISTGGEKVLNFVMRAITRATKKKAGDGGSEGVAGAVGILKKMLPYVDQQRGMEAVQVVEAYYLKANPLGKGKRAAAGLFTELLSSPDGDYWVSTPDAPGHGWMLSWPTYISQVLSKDSSAAIFLAKALGRCIRLYAGVYPLPREDLIGKISELLRIPSLPEEIKTNMVTSLYYLSPLPPPTLVILCEHARDSSLPEHLRLLPLEMLFSLLSNQSSPASNISIPLESYMTFATSALIPSPHPPYPTRGEQRKFVERGSSYVFGMPHPLPRGTEALQIIAPALRRVLADEQEMVVTESALSLILQGLEGAGKSPSIPKDLSDVLPRAMVTYISTGASSIGDGKSSYPNLEWAYVRNTFKFEVDLFVRIGRAAGETVMNTALSNLVEAFGSSNAPHVGPKVLSLIVRELGSFICVSSMHGSLSKMRTACKTFKGWDSADADRLRLDLDDALRNTKQSEIEAGEGVAHA